MPPRTPRAPRKAEDHTVHSVVVMKVWAYNPVILLVRVSGILAMSLLAYAVWQIGLSVWEIRGELDGDGWFLLASHVFGMLFIGLLGVLCFTALRSPQRPHLAAFVVVATIVAVSSLCHALLRFSSRFFTESAFETIHEPVMLSSVALGVLVAIGIEWRLAKRAGFVDQDERWWRESNIRGICIATAWIAGLAGTGMFAGPDALNGIVRDQYQSAAGSFVFFGTIVACVAFAKLAPMFLMRLTDVEPDPPTAKPKKRGFRLI